MDTIEYSLNPLPPFRLDLTVWVLRRRASNRIDQWDGKTWRRVMIVRGCPVLVAVEQPGGCDSQRLLVRLFAENMPENAESESKEALDRLLGINIDLAGFYSMVAVDSDIGPLAERFKGMRPPRYDSLFEAVSNGIIGQQISLNAAMSVLNRYTEGLGRPFRGEGVTFHAFPQPDDLASVEIERLKSMGLSGNKARALRDAAGMIVSGELDLRRIEMMDNASASVMLSSLRGIGPWTADYILLRGFGRLDIFPRKDSGALKALERRLPCRDASAAPASAKPVPAGRKFLDEAISRWRPYAGLVYFHLLLNGLLDEGLIK